MKKIFQLTFMSLSLLAMGFNVSAQNSPAEIPLEHFFKNAEKKQYQASPDGQYFSYLMPFANRMNIHIQKIGNAEVTRLTNQTERDIPGYMWKGSTIVYLQDKGGDENFQLFSVNVENKKEKALTPFEGTRSDILDELPAHPTDILVTNNKRNPEIFDVYRLNTQTGSMKMILENPGNHSSWLADHDGNIRVATTTDGVNSSFLYRPNEKAAWKEIFKTNFRESVSPLLFTFDNQKIYASSNRGRDKAAIVVIDPATGKETETLFQHPNVDVDDLEYSKRRKTLTHINFQYEKRGVHFLDEEYKKLYDKIADSLKGYEVVITSTNDEENVFIIRTFSDRSLGSYYMYLKEPDELAKLSDVSPWLNENLMAEMKPVTFQARDGLTLHGYLTLPKGGTQNLPVVVNPHGGPWARDFWGFNPEVQFLASRGYAVLQINFRGSTGYGRKFWESSFKQWGKTMQDDLTDGVNWLVKQGIANPKKVGIYGGSYGGYATLAGLAFTPEVYACGVDYVGVSNLFSFMKTIPPYWKPFLEMMYEMVGHPENDKDLFQAASPVFHVDKIKAPLFVAQGKNDPRVNIAESDQIVEALKKKGVDVPYMVKDNEGHGFHNEENRFDFYRAMEQFLAKYLKN